MSYRLSSSCTPASTSHDKRKIDMLSLQNARCVLLAMLGFSYRHIRMETGFCNYEIVYRLKLANVKLSDYRSGKSASAKQIQSKVFTAFGKFLASQLSEPGKRRVICVKGHLLLK